MNDNKFHSDKLESLLKDYLIAKLDESNCHLNKFVELAKLSNSSYAIAMVRVYMNRVSTLKELVRCSTDPYASIERHRKRLQGVELSV